MDLSSLYFITFKDRVKVLIIIGQVGTGYFNLCELIVNIYEYQLFT